MDNFAPAHTAVLPRPSSHAVSLRVRLASWSIVFALLCLGTFLLALTLYLRYALSSSRSESMHKREHRLLRYLSTDVRLHPELTWEQHLNHFLEATPETDIVEIDDPSGRRLYPALDPAPGLAGTSGTCDTPCLTTVTVDGHHARVLTHATTVEGRPIRLILIGTTDEHYDILHTIDVGFVGLLPLVVVASVLGGYALSRRALAPVGAMTAQARSLSLTHLEARIPEPPTGDELQELAQAWNDMLDRLEGSAKSITQFTADASHDMRTAITVVLANAQLALRRERTTERYQEVLSSIVTEAQHMSDMLEDLLLAARSGWSTDELAFEEVDLVAILREVYEVSLAPAALQEHHFCLDLQLDRLHIDADRMLLRRLISVLVNNAIKYTPPKGRIILRLRERDSGWLCEVEDDGVGVPPELRQRIFERLFRVDQDRQEGHGLGLAVAKWIAEAHHLELTMRPAPLQGSIFGFSR